MPKLYCGGLEERAGLMLGLLPLWQMKKHSVF